MTGRIGLLLACSPGWRCLLRVGRERRADFNSQFGCLLRQRRARRRQERRGQGAPAGRQRQQPERDRRRTAAPGCISPRSTAICQIAAILIKGQRQTRHQRQARQHRHCTTPPTATQVEMPAAAARRAGAAADPMNKNGSDAADDGGRPRRSRNRQGAARQGANPRKTDFTGATPSAGPSDSRASAGRSGLAERRRDESAERGASPGGGLRYSAAWRKNFPSRCPAWSCRASGEVATFMRLPVERDPAKLDIALVGVPWDGGTTNRPARGTGRARSATCRR